MAKINLDKTVSANSNGIIISFRDVNKNNFVPYQNYQVVETQKFGTAKYQKMVETQSFTEKQKDLYQKLVYGFSAYSPEEIKSMTKYKKINITIAYTKAHRMLKRWKQEILFKAVDDFMSSLFPKSRIVKQMCEMNGWSNEDDEISFSEIGITKFQIANKLVEFGLLPKNFFQLT